MRRLHTGPASFILLAAAACTSPGQPAQQADLGSACIEGARIRSHDVVSNEEIRFTLAGGEVLSNKLPRACPGLKAQGGFSWDISNRVCPGLQTIFVLESGIPCQLGEFTRVTTADTQG